MCLFEYDEELHRKSMTEYYREEGLRQGRAEGIQKGIQGTVKSLRRQNLTNEDILKEVVEVFGISVDEAKNIIATTP